MKLSAYYKKLGYQVELKMDYDNLYQYDKVFISKVFMDTEIPFEPTDKTLRKEDTIIDFYKDNELLNMNNVYFGGTGFYYDKAPPLPDEIEHIMPDYHLYDDYINEKIQNGNKEKDFDYFINYSIGMTTRGCIRQCSFCVNKNYKQAILHSPVEEFLDKSRKYICLLDDNVFACKDWKNVFNQLLKTNKRFQFKQGLDERLLTDEKAKVLFKESKWIGDYIFAFDNIKDKQIIEEKLKLIRKYTNRKIKFYVFCAYNHEQEGFYNQEFWHKDLTDLFERIKILMQYGCHPYIMRYKDYLNSPYKGAYINICSWCNQPHLFSKKSFREYCYAENERYKNKSSATIKYMKQIENDFPDIAEKYFDMKFQ